MSDFKKGLEGYETVKSRKQSFYQKFPDGRILVEALEIDHETAVFKATVFKNSEDQSKNLPLATGHAQEFKGQGGMANKFSWCENCEESAIGRALDNAGFATNNKCSQNEMEKVARGEAAQSDNPNEKFPESKNLASINKMSHSNAKPRCQLCETEMKIAKTGKSYYCPNFSDGRGEHSRVPMFKLEQYLQEQERAV